MIILPKKLHHLKNKKLKQKWNTMVSGTIFKKKHELEAEMVSIQNKIEENGLCQDFLHKEENLSNQLKI
jgi:hypothetical protein